MGAIPSIPTDPSRKVKVIAAAYGRTGTVSTSLALAKLLDGPVLHGGTQLLARDDEYCRLWLKAYEAKAAGENEKCLKYVQQATAGYVATADLPTVHFIPELRELYPDAKVVLVNRDPVKWWNSVVALASRATPWWLALALAPIPGWRHIPEFMNIWGRKTPGATDSDNRAQRLAKGGPHLLEMHNDRVRALVPKEQLLEMKLDEGWGPLCRFLDLPIPNEPFPRANDNTAMTQYANKIMLTALKVWLGIFSVGVVAVYSAFSLWRMEN
ncbi:hypothetical protein F5Y13DRAFT_162888 [Hypoxylon sp. FL1857]|nr:hypothetical protein F5Y13DRAFT_162888 [Hypoxylon sp. FL1857]